MFDRYNYNNMPSVNKCPDTPERRYPYNSYYRNNGKNGKFIKPLTIKRMLIDRQFEDELNNVFEFPDNPLEKVRIKIKKSVKLRLDWILAAHIANTQVYKNELIKVNNIDSLLWSYLILVYLIREDGERVSILDSYKASHPNEENVIQLMAAHFDEDKEYDHIEISKITAYLLRILKTHAKLKNDSRAIIYLLGLFYDESKYTETLKLYWSKNSKK